MLYETTKPYPRVVLSELGESINQMQQASSYPFTVKSWYSEGSWPYYAGDNRHFIFEYQHDALGFSLPPSRYGYFPSFMGHIVEAKVTPHLKALTEKEALALIHQLSAQFDSIGWQRTSRYNPSDTEILTKFHEPPIKDGISMWVSYWQNGDTELYIEMKRIELLGKKNKGKPVYAYLVTVFLENKKIYEHYMQLWMQTPD